MLIKCRYLIAMMVGTFSESAFGSQQIYENGYTKFKTEKMRVIDPRKEEAAFTAWKKSKIEEITKDWARF